MIDDFIYTIPCGLTEGHEDLFPCFQRFRDAVVLTIDAHADMYDHAPLLARDNPDYHLFLEHDNYLCPAVHYGMVSLVYWLNPHSTERRLQLLGDTTEEGYNSLRTQVSGDEINWRIPVGKVHLQQGLKISPEQMKIKHPFIINVDLDAFCCHRKVIPYTEFGYDGVSGWEQRIIDTIDLLRPFTKPDFIGVTKSQKPNKKRNHIYVPPDKVDDVLDMYIERIKQLYS